MVNHIERQKPKVSDHANPYRPQRYGQKDKGKDRSQKLLAIILYDTMREPAREARRSLGDQSDLTQAIGHLYDNVTAQVEKFVANDLLVRSPS